MKVSVLTLGCRVNQSESDIIEGNLKKFGWSIVGLSENPEYCIVNTCTVTAKSDYQSRQLIRRAVRAGAKVIATGCYSQLWPDDVRNIKGVMGVINKNKIYNVINTLTNNNASITFCYGSRSRPYLKVQDGCNFACSYCVVPMARGRSRSLEISEVIKHAREIETSGYSEVVLTGIHLGSYGHDLEPKANLSELLRYILKNTQIPRIRLSSLAVKEVDNELIELLKEERICKHLHLPLQSGDDRILRLMNRQYTSRDYLATVEDILKKVPDIALGTDIIVGFPGEGDEEFINTKRLIGALPISYIHIFPFSQRPNTLAYRMPKQNTSEVKRERLNELKAINAKKKMAYMLSQMSRTLEVIIEEQGDDNIAIGTSSNYLKVEFPSNGYNKGALVRVRAVGMVGNIVRADSVDKL